MRSVWCARGRSTGQDAVRALAGEVRGMSDQRRWQMLGRVGRRAVVLAAPALVCAAAIGAVAIASPFSAPQLKAPRNHHRVHAGVITLIVKDPGVPRSV